MNAQTNAIAPADSFKQALTRFEGQINTVSQQLAVSLPSHISVEKFQRTLMAAVKSDPELLRADRASLINACEKAALDGLLPDKREAALVIFKRNYKDAGGNWQQALDVAYMPMAYGLRKKILQSGEVTDITAKVVYRREHEEGVFIYEEGTEAMLRHRPLMDLSMDDANDENIVAVYSMATYKDGTKSYEVMRRFEVDRVRECSQTGATRDRKGQPRKPSGPWVDFYPEMAKKTVMRRHSKTLPMSGDLMIDVEGRELDVSANSTARMLAVEPDAPIALPSSEELSGQTVDPEPGEITRTDSRGMTEVDEETARALDAGESVGHDEDDEPTEPQRPSKGKGAEATHFGTRTPDARHGESWYNPDDKKLRYAHEIDGVIKWYVNAPKPEDQDAPAQADPEQSQAEVAEQTAQDIDGPLDQQANETPGDMPQWMKQEQAIRDLIDVAETMADWRKADQAFQNVAASLPDGVRNGLDAILTDRLKQLRAQEG